MENCSKSVFNIHPKRKCQRIIVFNNFFSAFHSCVGGCNGCINLNHEPNKGLEDIVVSLEDKYQKLKLADQGISRADFWALAGMLAIEKGASLHLVSVIDFWSYLFGLHSFTQSYTHKFEIQ